MQKPETGIDISPTLEQFRDVMSAAKRQNRIPSGDEEVALESRGSSSSSDPHQQNQLHLQTDSASTPEQRIDFLVKAFKESNVLVEEDQQEDEDIEDTNNSDNNVLEDGHNTTTTATTTRRMSTIENDAEIRGYQRASWWTQFRILSGRAFKNLYRNPILLLTHYAVSIVLALVCAFLFYDITYV